jgi:hypothetical protein
MNLLPIKERILSSQEAEAEGLNVQGQPGIHGNTLALKINKIPPHTHPHTNIPWEC